MTTVTATPIARSCRAGRVRCGGQIRIPIETGPRVPERPAAGELTVPGQLARTRC